MLKVALLDANTPTNKELIGEIRSMVGHWIRWEMERHNVEEVDVSDCDVVFIVHAGAINFVKHVRRELRRNKIEPDVKKRNGKPYVIAGGSVDASAYTALALADVCAIGEAYNFIRETLKMIHDGATVDDLQKFMIEFEYCIEHTQLDELERDSTAPWLLQSDAPILATPDPFVDWEIPAVKSDDKVIRAIGSKGCRKKCSFCATTYRQPFTTNPDMDTLRTTLGKLSLHGERTQIVTNDVVDLPFFDELSRAGLLDSQSMSFGALRRPGQIRRLIRARPRISRFGLEGLSPRIRKAFGKPVPNEEVMDILTRLHENKIMSHLFLICAAPYESAEDLEEWKEFYMKLATTLKWGMCRIKYTTFQPCPPAPLARFVSGRKQQELIHSLRTWIPKNIASRHMLNIWGKQYKGFCDDLVDATGVPLSVWEDVQMDDETFDMCPTVEEARRMPWEIVKWPLSVEQRWKIGSVYRRRMGGGDVMGDFRTAPMIPEQDTDRAQLKHLAADSEAPVSAR